MLKKLALTAALLAGGFTVALPTVAVASTAATQSVAPQSAVSPLLKPAELKSLLGQPDVRVLDIRAAKDYASGHIPGAINTPYAAWRGPQDNPGALPAESHLTELLRKAGIDASSRVIVVHAGTDHTDFGAAARVYWTLKAGGLNRLSVLDGGTQDWQEAGGALDTTVPSPAPTQFSYRYNSSMLVNTQELAAAVSAGKTPVLVDARPLSFFKGEQRAEASARYGTLPGAQALDNARFFNADRQTLKPTNELVEIAQQSGLARTPTVSFCNTGHWAATNWFVLSEIVGNKDVRLYPESVVEWSKTDLPMDNQPSRLTALKLDMQRSLNK